MRLIGAASIVFILAVAFAVSGFVPGTQADQTAAASERERATRHKDGQAIFRFDTFGDEQLWTDVLRMHEVIPTVDPATALAVGLKVDVEALPVKVVAALRAGQVDLTDPAVTVELLRLNAVVGVKGTVDEAGRLTKVGVTCALCHSSVDDSFAPGIGRRLDGWANTDLNVGAIVALSPALDDATKAEFRTWGAGKYDPRHHAFDGINLIPLNSPSLPIVIPPIYGLKGVGFETFTGDGPISYWNSYVGVGPDGRPRQLQRSANRIVHQADAGSRHAEAGRAAGLPIEPAQPGAAARQLRSQGRRARKGAVPEPGQVQHVPSVAELHGRAERSGSDGSIPARSRRSRHGSGVCREVGDRQVPDDATARASAAPAVFPRRERARSAGRRQSLRHAVRAEPDTRRRRRTSSSISSRCDRP